MTAERAAWTPEEIYSIIYHDGLSRVSSFTGLTHLSIDHAKIIKLTLSGGQEPSNSGGSSSSSSSKINNNEHKLPLEEAPSSKRRKGIRGARDSLSTKPENEQKTKTGFDVFPRHFQIHNARCTTCDNALFIGLNCASTRGGGLECLVCMAVMEREVPNAESKRQFRSVETLRKQQQQQQQQQYQQSSSGSKRVRREDSKDDEMKLDDVVLRKENVEVMKPEMMTLEDRLADAKRKSKEKKKMQKVAALNEDAPLQQAQVEKAASLTLPTLPGSETKGLTEVKPASLQDSSTRLEKVRENSTEKGPLSKAMKAKGNKKEASSQKEALRQLLAQKKARQEASSPAESSQRGLAGFLDSL